MPITFQTIQPRFRIGSQYSGLNGMSNGFQNGNHVTKSSPGLGVRIYRFITYANNLASNNLQSSTEGKKKDNPEAEASDQIDISLKPNKLKKLKKPKQTMHSERFYLNFRTGVALLRHACNKLGIDIKEIFNNKIFEDEEKLTNLVKYLDLTKDTFSRIAKIINQYKDDATEKIMPLSFEETEDTRKAFNSSQSYDKYKEILITPFEVNKAVPTIKKTIERKSKAPEQTLTDEEILNESNLKAHNALVTCKEELKLSFKEPSFNKILKSSLLTRSEISFLNKAHEVLKGKNIETLTEDEKLILEITKKLMQEKTKEIHLEELRRFLFGTINNALEESTFFQLVCPAAESRFVRSMQYGPARIALDILQEKICKDKDNATGTKLFVLRKLLPKRGKTILTNGGFKNLLSTINSDLLNELNFNPRSNAEGPVADLMSQLIKPETDALKIIENALTYAGIKQSINFPEQTYPLEILNEVLGSAIYIIETLEAKVDTKLKNSKPKKIKN